MHHRATRPSVLARLVGGPRRGRRLALGVAVPALVTGFVLAAPVVSGPQPGTALDASTGSSDSPVVMGRDGRATSATFASASARLTLGPDGVRVEEPASRSGRTPVATAPGSAAPRSAAPTPVAAPPEVEAPAPPAAVVEAPSATPEAPAPVPTAAPETPRAAATPSTTAPRTTLPAATAPPSAPAPAAIDRAIQVLALVNEERAAAGCRPLVADDELTAVAAAHSADMRDQGFFDHVNLAGLSPFDRADAAGVSARAENIARGQEDAAAVMDSWMASPGHRANVLDCSLTRLGVGIADGGGGPWWTQLFG